MAFVPLAPVSVAPRQTEKLTTTLYGRPCRASKIVRRRDRCSSGRLTCDLRGSRSPQEVGSSLTPEDDASTQKVSELRSEHLVAYFDADESMYQVRLGNVLRLSIQNFTVEVRELQLAIRRLMGINPPLRYTPPECLGFKLENEAVNRREANRESSGGMVKTSWLVRKVYDFTCVALDVLFEGRPVPRFWFLETVARMPYFSYSSCLHLLSTLGWYRSPTLMNMHHAEELNEAYHLAVMESLGGDKRWQDRFLAFHASLAYYWFLVFLFFVSPAESYRFSQMLEAHAVDTYTEFIDANKDVLDSLAVPDVAYEYFREFRYYFDEFQLSEDKLSNSKRHPEIYSLLGVFENILMDEREHTRTMSACVDFVEKGEQFSYNGKVVSASSRRPNVIPSAKREKFWRQWSNVDDTDVDV